MAYASLPDVAAKCPARTFTASSIPSADDVAVYLDEVSAELDGIVMARGYVLPVVGTQALLLMKRLAAVGAWAQVEGAAQVSHDAERAAKLWGTTRSALERGNVELDLPRRVTSGVGQVTAAASAYFTRDMEF